MSGKRGPAYPAIAIWAAFLAALTAVSLVFGPEVSTPALLGGNAAAVAVLAIGLALTRRSIQSDGGGADPEGSPATVWLALSLALICLGAALGLWLVYIAAGMATFGVAGLVREHRAEAAARRAHRSSDPGAAR